MARDGKHLNGARPECCSRRWSPGLEKFDDGRPIVRWYSYFVKLKARLVLLCVGAFVVALLLEAVLSTHPRPGESTLVALIRDHGLGVAAGLLGGALPFLVLLSRHLGTERRSRAVTDAQELRRAAAHLADIEEVHDANRLVAVGRFTSMAHELGTPLGVVQARAQMIAGGEVTGAELQKDIEIILQQTRRMTGMVREVLELARQKTSFEALVDLVALTRQAMGMIDPAAQQHHVRFRLIDTGARAQARGDASKLLQVLTNLTNNAHESMPGGGIVTLAVGSRRATAPADMARDISRDYVYVEVQDEGAGIPTHQMPHIFDTFYTTKQGGSGLGLSVSYRIASEHGGWIAAASEPGAGSCFTLFLPQPSPAGD